MHYAISHHNNEFPYLVIQPRKRSLKHVLLRVNQGLALLKLGKIEYAIEDGQTVWLPFDALVGLTFFPNTCAQRVEVSCRIYDKNGNVIDTGKWKFRESGWEKRIIGYGQNTKATNFKCRGKKF